jgi:hypothetical protein
MGLSCCLTTIYHSAYWNAEMMIVSGVGLHVASGKQFSLTEPLLLGVSTHHGVQHAIAIAQGARQGMISIQKLPCLMKMTRKMVKLFKSACEIVNIAVQLTFHKSVVFIVFEKH